MRETSHRSSFNILQEFLKDAWVEFKEQLDPKNGRNTVLEICPEFTILIFNFKK